MDNHEKKEVVQFVSPAERKDPDRIRYEEIKRRMIERLNNPTAGTGKSLEDLTGAAYTIARESNLGGGSIEIGGSGILGGIEELSKMLYLEGVLDERYGRAGKSTIDNLDNVALVEPKNR